MQRNVLLFKIVVTVLFWAAPLTFFPPEVFRYLGFPYQGTYLFIRLLGVAYWGLIAGYAWGIIQNRRGIDTTGILVMGLISNGGALATLLVFHLRGSFSAWGIPAQAYLAASMAMLLAISMLLGASLLRGGVAARRS